MAYAILNGMTLKIDSAGRIVVPKPLRERLGLTAGAEVELTEAPEGLLLKPVNKRPSLVHKGPFLIHQGTPPPGFDAVRAVEQDREDRLRSLLGPQ
jgi:AbrB family looped-hinge helix DNA binding protein